MIQCAKTSGDGRSRLRISVLAAVLAAALLPAAHGASSVVSNVEPRRDKTTGEILDIHDGTTIRVGDVFFWYGAGYGNCQEMVTGCHSIEVGACGFQLNHTVNLATSTDLVNWTFHGPVLSVADRPEGIMFSPWVARSHATGLYVLWFNMLPTPGGKGDFNAAYYSVATSASPYGPFKLARTNVSGIAYTRLPDAPSIFVDDDGSGYIAFTHEDTHVNTVQQLTPDLMGPLTGSHTSAIIGGPNNEGILMFKRQGLYYIMFGQCCCFCREGANVQAFVASSPLGPYKEAGMLANAGDWGAQTGAVWFTGVDWVLFGDRWQSAPDRIKAHDFSYMTPFSFTANGSVVPIHHQDTVTIQY